MDAVKDLDCQYVEENDLVSAYLAGRLSEEEAEAFEKHFFGCEKCWGEVKAGEEIRAALKSGHAAGAAPAQSNVRRGPWTTWRVLALAAAVGVAAAGAVLVLRLGQATGIDALARAAGSRRTTEARLTGAFAYGAVEPISRGTESTQDVPIKLRRVALETFEKAQDSPSAETLHAAGLAHLVLNEWDEAVTALEAASRLAPRDAGIWSDLAATLLARASSRARAADLPKAYEAARKAADINPSLAPARFNLALALENLGHREQARAAWKAYLQLDARSGWALEAADREKRLSGPPQSLLWEQEKPELIAAADREQQQEVNTLVRRFPQQSRQLVEDEILPGWGSLSDRAEAARTLRQAHTIAQALESNKGENLALGAVAAIESAPVGLVQSLRDGHRLFGEARRLYRAADIAGAIGAFRHSEERFRGCSTPFVHLARLGQASCHLYGSDTHAATPLVASLESATTRPSLRYPALAGQTLWLRGMIDAGDGRPYEGLQDYERALDIFGRLGERENIAGLHGLISAELRFLGRPEEAWSHNVAELSMLDSGSAPSRITNALGEIVRVSLDEGYPRLALLADNAEVRISESRGIPLFLSYSRLWRAQAEAALGRIADAQEDLVRARAANEAVKDDQTRARTTADIEVAAARLLSSSDPAHGLEAINRAIVFATSVSSHDALPELFLLRGHLYRAQGQLALARRDFDDGIREVEASRDDISLEAVRVSYFEAVRSLFDEAVTLGAASGDEEGAFLRSDRAHGRALLDSLSGEGRAIPVLTGELLRMRLGPQRALIEYWISERQSYVWVTRADGIQMTTLPAGRLELAEKVDGLVAALARPGGSSESRPAAELYDLLVRPIENQLSNISTLVVVPDGPLHRIPFASLHDRQRSQYLIERFALSISPSAALVLTHDDRAAARQGSPRVLVVANPSFDQARFPKLPRLASADAEADAILKVFPAAYVLRGGEATKAAFLRLSPAYDLIHFAGHAIVNMADPRFSALLFAPDPTDPSDSGILYAHELSKVDLSRVQLVVLAACGTASGLVSNSEGAATVARSFLAAGASMAIGALWRVEDDRTAELMSRLYSALPHSTPGDALRAAQVAMLRRSPATATGWAGATLLGGIQD